MANDSAVAFLIGPMAMIIAVAASGIVYQMRATAADGSKRSLMGFAAKAVAAGFAGALVGYILGIVWFCTEGAGAQCGLVAVFVTTPVAFGLALGVFLIFWGWRAAA